MSIPSGSGSGSGGEGRGGEGRGRGRGINKDGIVGRRVVDWHETCRGGGEIRHPVLAY